MLDFNQKIAVFRLCLRSSTIKVDEVINWADASIANLDEPNECLLELSNLKKGDLNKVITVLNNYAKDLNNEIVWQTAYGVIGQFYNCQKLNLKNSCYAIYYIALMIRNQTGQEIAGFSLDDSYSIYGDKMKNELIVCVSPFLSFGENFIATELR